MARLTYKRRVFVEKYLTLWNGTKAAEAAGYANPRQEASRLLSNDDIQALIEQRIAAFGMSAGEVIAHLAEIARFDVGDILTAQGSIDWAAAKSGGYTRMIKRIKETAYLCTEVHTYDRIKALELLGKHLAMWVDRTEHTGAGGGPMLYTFKSNVDDDKI